MISSTFTRLATNTTGVRSSKNLFQRFAAFHSSRVALEKLNVEGLAQKVNLEGQNVLMRVDLNVPLSKEDDVTVTDDTRLRAIVPTAKFLLDKGANVILCSHFGRPKGEIIETGKNGRLNPVVPHLEKLLNTKGTLTHLMLKNNIGVALKFLSIDELT